MLKTLLLLTSFLSGCISIDEPDPIICVPITEKVADCFKASEPEKVFEKEIKLMRGWACVDENSLGEIVEHHKILHDEIDLCE